MSVIIAYDSKYGATRCCAAILAERVRGPVALADLGEQTSPDLGPHAVVLLGGPIYAGRPRACIPRFCSRSRAALLERQVGLFICCLETGEQARLQLENAFPDWLRAHAFAELSLGGSMRMDALGPVDRFIIRRLAGTRRDIDRPNTAAMEELAARASRAATGRPPSG